MKILVSAIDDRPHVYMTKRSSKSICTVLCFVTPIVVAIAAAEVYARHKCAYIVPDESSGGLAIYSTKGKRLRPNATLTMVDGEKIVRISTNSHGFRDHEMAVQKDPGEIRILVLGDSITLGLGYALEDTFVGRVEAQLRESLGGNIHTINAGIDGLGIKNEVEILAEKGVRLSPDIVLLHFYLNDSQDTDEFGTVLTNPGWLRRNSVLAETLYRRYMLRQWIAGKIEKYPQYVWTSSPPPKDISTNPQSFLNYAATAELDWGSAWQKDSWTVVEQEFKRLAELSHKYNFKVVVVCTPVIFQVYTEYLENYPQRKLASLAKQNDFYYCDLLPTFRGVNRETMLFDDHCHYSGFGHVLVAKQIANYLGKEILPNLITPMRSTSH